jgi:hypothetical protein
MIYLRVLTVSLEVVSKPLSPLDEAGFRIYLKDDLRSSKGSMAALQTSGKCSHTTRMLRFPDLSRHSPTLFEGRRRIGLQLAEHL